MSFLQKVRVAAETPKMVQDQIVDIEVEGVDPKDAPDYANAYIASANWKDGRKLSDTELDKLNEDSDFVYDAVLNSLRGLRTSYWLLS